MLLTFKRREHSLEACSPTGATLFSITASTASGDEALVVRTELPGLDPYTRVDLPEGVSKYGSEASKIGIAKCVELLLGWMADVLDVDVAAGRQWTGVEYDPEPPAAVAPAPSTTRRRRPSKR